ncbi:secretory lipase-domain-containing protein [Aspergillus undulatus]|uniref:secretory lipase-domain-containing protein n=1 Tax=Aspergillus undulatus TaxID=1810928 RepID=UPI003CCD1854
MAILFFQFVILLVPFLSAALPGPVRRQGPPTPGEDPFYTLPAGWESVAPGAILRHRTPPFPVAAFGLAEVNLDASHQILYRTTNSFGNPITSVTTVLIPHNADYTKVLSYQVAQDAADPNCSPSFAIQQFSDAGEALALIMPQIEYLLMSSALNKGFVVIIPDHLGPNSAFLASILSGQAVLDNVRAALASTDFTGISSTATVALWGYSGGSLSSGFAAELQPSYATELNITGAALGGTVPNFLPIIEAANRGIYTGLIPAGIQGLANEYPSTQRLIREGIRPERWADFNRTLELCLTGNILEYLGDDFYSYINDPNIFESPLATEVLEANTMGHGPPEFPILIYKSVNDQISPINDTDALYNTYCGNGADVEYVTDQLSEHTSLAVTGAPDAFIWLTDRLSGVPVTRGCTTRTQLTGLQDPRALLALGDTIVRLLLGFLSLPVGPIGG